MIGFRLRLGVISPRIVFPNRPDLDQIVPDESNILKKRRSVVVLVGRWSGEGRVLTLRRHYARPSVESGRCYTKATEGGRDKGAFIFAKMRPIDKKRIRCYRDQNKKMAALNYLK